MRPSTFFSSCRRVAALMLLLLLATAAYAQFTPSDDSYVNAKAATTNYGTSKTLDISSAADTVFIRFDLTAVPSGYTGSSVAKATLKLYMNTVVTAGSFNVDLVNGTWTEGTIDYSNAPALGTTIAASVPLAKSNALDYISIDITPAVVDWLNGTANDGIALVANSPLSATFDSKESTTTSHSAELDIVFASSAGGGTITGVLTGTGSGLQGGGTSGTLNLSLLTSCSSGQVLAWNGSAWACSSPSGGGTITGVTAGTDLTGGGTSGNVTLNLDITKVPQLATANTFTGNQTVNGNLSATQWVSSAGFEIGSNPFAYGSYANYNALLGFAGNPTMTGISNTAVGYAALGQDTTGYDNAATGWYALNANTTGQQNTAYGAAALIDNTTGQQNTASGEAALASNSTGNYNAALGTAALLDSTGSWNTGAGAWALYRNTTGADNTAVGYDALDNNTTGGNNTAVGYNAGPDSNSPGLTNATAIGANAVVSESNALVLGGTGSNAVSVGIGTATPAYTLDVQGSGRFTQPIVFASGQSFPGSGTITGVTAGTALTGGGTSGNVTLNVDTTKVVTGLVAGTDLTGGGTGGVLTLNLDTTKVPQLAAANTFSGAQTINNNVTITAANTTLTASGGATGVSGSGSTYGLYGTYTGTGTGAGVYGTGSYWGVWGSGGGYGVYGNSTGGTGVYGYGGTGGTGVYGTGSYGLSGSGYTYGVYGTYTGNSGGAGVYGYDNSSGGTGVSGSGGTTGVSGSGGTTGVSGSGSTYGVAGTGTYGFNGSGTSVGLYADGCSSGTNCTVATPTGVEGTGYSYGVVGVSNVGYGVYGQSAQNNGVTGDGVYGVVGLSGYTYAGVFYGVVYGTAFVSAFDSLQIDHPLDPANKYLNHAAVESSEMMNIYTGNVTTDALGEATVQLPDWFEAVNTDFRYQLTVIGQFAQAIVASEIQNHQFAIRTSVPKVKVSWQVTGVRQDAYAKAHPLIVETEKPDGERGKYLTPVENGQPKEMGIWERVRPKLELPKLPQQPPIPAWSQTNAPVPQQHVAIPEPPK